MESGDKKYNPQFYNPLSANHSKPRNGDVELFTSFVHEGDFQSLKEYYEQFPLVVNDKEKSHGNVALHIACSKGNSQIAVYLLNHGANPNAQDIFGNGALHYATDKRRLDLMKILLQHSADINLQDHRGVTALHVACQTNYFDGVKLLLEENADPEIVDLAGVRCRDKSSLKTIHALIDRKLHSLNGGDIEVATQAVNWMGFGIGMGVGLGLALAKQQQFYLDQEKQKMLNEMKTKIDEQERWMQLQEENLKNSANLSKSYIRNGRKAVMTPIRFDRTGLNVVNQGLTINTGQIPQSPPNTVGTANTGFNALLGRLPDSNASFGYDSINDRKFYK